MMLSFLGVVHVSKTETRLERDKQMHNATLSCLVMLCNVAAGACVQYKSYTNYSFKCIAWCCELKLGLSDSMHQLSIGVLYGHADIGLCYL